VLLPSITIAVQREIFWKTIFQEILFDFRRKAQKMASNSAQGTSNGQSMRKKTKQRRTVKGGQILTNKIVGENTILFIRGFTF
jgi:hypothetical protein